MMPCSKIKSLPPKGVYYSLFQSIDAATLTTDWEAKPDQSVVIKYFETVGCSWIVKGEKQLDCKRLETVEL